MQVEKLTYNSNAGAKFEISFTWISVLVLTIIVLLIRLIFGSI